MIRFNPARYVILLFFRLPLVLPVSPSSFFFLPFSLPSSSPPMWRRYNRSASLAITSFGAVTNLAITIHVLVAWRSLKWEPESEWESSGGNWRLDGVKILWALLFIYFTSAATVCILGLLGILKVLPLLSFFYHSN